MTIRSDGVLSALERASGWLNSEPLTAAGLAGRVVLVDFWTYSCINWIRTAPYIRAWAERYEPRGLVVVGVHTPEFEFEKDVDHVRRAVREMGVRYPVALDPEYAIWRGFDNHYWPALYFVDARGQIRHHHFGEGEYEQSERRIQQLLEEAGAGTGGGEPASVDAAGVEAAADWGSLKSPETYLGYLRAQSFASPDGPFPDERRVYAAPGRLRLNQWAVSGDWTIARESAVLHAAGGRISFRFLARDLHLVIGPAVEGGSVRFRVLLDGEPPGASHGLDIDGEGYGTVTEPRLHQLVRQAGSVAERLFEITFLDPGVEAYVFTFG
jgi:thiol-disulfide isomerase/thioredoxin